MRFREFGEATATVAARPWTPPKHFKPLQKDITIIEPSYKSNAGQKTVVPKGTLVGISAGGDMWRQKIIKFDAAMDGKQRQFTVDSDKFFAAMSTRKQRQKQVDEGLPVTEMFSTGAIGYRIFNVDKQVFNSLQGTFPDAHTEFSPMSGTATIHFDEPVTDEIDSKMDRFNSNWKTSAMALRDKPVEETAPDIPAAQDRSKGYELDAEPSVTDPASPGFKRSEQKAGRNLRRRWGMGHEQGKQVNEGGFRGIGPLITVDGINYEIEHTEDSTGDKETIVVWDREQNRIGDIEIDHNLEFAHGDLGHGDEEIDYYDISQRSEEEVGTWIASVAEPNVEEAIVPNVGDEEYPFIDDETGEVFPAGMASSVNFDDDEDEEDDDDHDEQWHQDWADYNKGRKEKSEAEKAEAMSMFGDIAAGGGDPIDHLITMHKMDIEEIDALAQEQGYEDANEWAESFADHHEMESILSLSKRINK